MTTTTAAGRGSARRVWDPERASDRAFYFRMCTRLRALHRAVTRERALLIREHSSDLERSGLLETFFR